MRRGLSTLLIIALAFAGLACGRADVTIVGGEPALEPGRLKKIHDNFKMNVATNGLIRIPYEGLENMPMGVAVWGNRETDARLRGQPGKDLLSRALDNYRGDPRAFFYYTVAPGHAHEIEAVVDAIEEALETADDREVGSGRIGELVKQAGEPRSVTVSFAETRDTG